MERESPALLPPPSEVGWAEIRRVRQTHSGRVVRADRSHISADYRANP